MDGVQGGSIRRGGWEVGQGTGKKAIRGKAWRSEERAAPQLLSQGSLSPGSRHLQMPAPRALRWLDMVLSGLGLSHVIKSQCDFQSQKRGVQDL